jgi:hypothetical protein
MRAEMSLYEHAARERFLGTRFRALELRDELERLLTENQEVVLDFTGVETTQSFIDELIGVLVLEHGPKIIERLVFKSCSESMRSIINFVLGDRIEQYSSRFTAQH